MFKESVSELLYTSKRDVTFIWHRLYSISYSKLYVNASAVKITTKYGIFFSKTKNSKLFSCENTVYLEIRLLEYLSICLIRRDVFVQQIKNIGWSI